MPISLPASPTADAAPAATTARTQIVAADVGRAAGIAVVVGAVLGVWCRAWSDGAAGLVGDVVADLGAPWILAAFASGVAVAGRHRVAALDRSSGVLAGGLAGGGALAVASLVYYDGSTGPRAVFWIGLGLVVGGLAGGAGAAWAIWPRSAAGAAAATALGLSLATEGVARLGGVFRMDGSPTAEVTVLALVGLGVLVPLVLTRGSPAGLVGGIGVVALAAPSAAVLAAGSTLLSLHPPL